MDFDSSSPRPQPPSSFPLQNSEAVERNHDLNADDGGNDTGVSVVGVNGGADDDGGDGSENDGFVSGEEEFESPRVFPGGKSVEGDVVDVNIDVDADADSGATFFNPAEFFTPMVERPVTTEVSLEQGSDGDGNLNFDGEEGSGSGSAEKSGPGVVSFEDKEDSVQVESNFGEAVNEGGLTDSHHEEFVEASGGGDGDDGGDKGSDSESWKFDGNEIAAEGEDNGVKLYDLKDGIKEVVNNVTEHNNGLSSEYDGQQQHTIPKEATDGGNGGGEVSTRGAGDSLVDTPQVDLLASGVAVVGDKEEVDESEIEGVEASARGMSLNNGFDPIKQDAEEGIDKIAHGDAECDENVDTEAGDDAAHTEKGQKSDIAPPQKDEILESESYTLKDVQDDINTEINANEGETGSHVEAPDDFHTSENMNPHSSLPLGTREDEDDGEELLHPGDNEIDGSASDGGDEGMIFGSSEAAKRFLEDLEQQTGAGAPSGGAESSRDHSQRIDGQIVTDSEEEVDTDDEGDGKELFDSAALAALLKAATGAGQDGGNITITSQDGSRLFSVERPPGLGPSRQSGRPAPGSNRANLFTPSIGRVDTNSDSNLSEEEEKKLEKLQQIRVKFLRLVQRLGFIPEESIAAQVLYRLTLVAGRHTGQLFSLDAAKESASQLEAEGSDDLNYSLNILVLGKTGVGKSATINSIFGETKTSIGAYGPATNSVTEIVGMVDGVKIRIFDTPGLKSSGQEQSFNRKVLSLVKKFTKKSPPDIVLYVDRLDTQTRDLNDLPLLRTITNALGPTIWRNAIVALTHAASAPPDGPSGSPLSYDVFVAQRSHIVQQTIGQAVGDLRLMNPSLMNPVSLVENHPSCRKNRDGHKVLPNGQSWRPMLLLLCYSMKILSEAGSLSKTQEPFDHRKLFGFRVRSPPLPYLLSGLLQSRTHPKLPADQGGVDNGDSDIELADLSDSDLDEDEDEYDQLLPFKPLNKYQVDKLSREQRKAYFEEYDYRVKLLQKKQWREELKRMREMKKKGKTTVNDSGFMEEDDQENGSPAAMSVPLPDMALPPSFDSDNPAYRYRFLEPTSQLLTRPVLDTHSWDHDCGYDGVNLEHSLAIINQFPAAVAVQITKDKKDFSIHLDSSVAAKHGENGSTMAGFDIQNIGKQLAYILRGETKFKNFKRNKTTAGVSVTFLGENVSTGLKVEDQIALGKRLVLVGSAGTVRSQGVSAYGSNLEVRLREADFPIGQDQSSLSLSLVKWRGELALGANLQSQFSVGRSYKMAVRAGLNNKLSGQISVKTSSSDQLQIALLAVLPIARAIYRNFRPNYSENYSIY